ncbi:calcium-binding protein [Streptomyces phyllanthi]|uniref:Calcium-binding protein n=1 Tax=Streptomyces phyllanthi TaxID=1803180 RepID=A0A5N8WC55_9ACTN|nr:hypothetical protein [Streptomyces phyllanthi]MPY44889.1 hypothetical protein [Streptomyces phyllanthi]
MGMAMAEDGNDTIHTGDEAIAPGRSGVDTIHANGAEGGADGGTGNDFVHGGAGRQRHDGDDDTVRGGTGNDFLHRRPGVDILYGNSDNDTLYDGPGRDTLSGGPGTDVVRQDWLFMASSQDA